jgi:hypothetical protein
MAAISPLDIKNRKTMTHLLKYDTNYGSSRKPSVTGGGTSEIGRSVNFGP